MNLDVDALLARLDIQAVRRGVWRVARCPSPEHDDHSPSWAIRDEPGSTRHATHRCLACGFWGGALTLVRAVLRCDREQALEVLATLERAGPNVPLAVELVERGGSPFLGEAAVPDGVYFEPLGLWPAAAREYLNERGVYERQVERWGMGYAVEGELAGRVVFVVREPGGRVVGWQARSWKGKRPKYKNPSRGAPGVQQGAVFGMEHWPSSGRGSRRVVVVEGPFDGLAVEAATGEPFACLTGSDLHPAQVQRLSAWGELVVATDPDEAGDKAAALVGGMARWARVTRARLPEGEDCSSLYARDPGRLRLLLGGGISTDGDRRAAP